MSHALGNIYHINGVFYPYGEWGANFKILSKFGEGAKPTIHDYNRYKKEQIYSTKQSVSSQICCSHL